MNVATDRPRIAVVGAADTTALGSVGHVVAFVEDAVVPPDLVIVDGTLPDVGAFCRAIRAGSDVTRFPILVVSADGDSIAALDAGADAVIPPTAGPTSSSRGRERERFFASRRGTTMLRRRPRGSRTGHVNHILWGDMGRVPGRRTAKPTRGAGASASGGRHSEERDSESTQYNALIARGRFPKLLTREFVRRSSGGSEARSGPARGWRPPSL